MALALAMTLALAGALALAMAGAMAMAMALAGAMALAMALAGAMALARNTDPENTPPGRSLDRTRNNTLPATEVAHHGRRAPQ